MLLLKYALTIQVHFNFTSLVLWPCKLQTLIFNYVCLYLTCVYVDFVQILLHILVWLLKLYVESFDSRHLKLCKYMLKNITETITYFILRHGFYGSYCQNHCIGNTSYLPGYKVGHHFHKLHIVKGDSLIRTELLTPCITYPSIYLTNYCLQISTQHILYGIKSKWINTKYHGTVKLRGCTS